MRQDTDSVAQGRYYELLRAAGPARRLEAAVSLSAAVRALAEEGIRERHPHAAEDEVRVRLAVRLYGREVARSLFAQVPDDAV